jgi:hypothetical protein
MHKLSRGVALVEFALILPLLLVLTFFTTEFGRAMYQYNSMTKSVRDAARYLSMQLPNTHTTEARNLVVYGNLAGTGNPVASGLTTGHVPPPIWQQAQGADPPVINTVTVEIQGYTFQSMFTSAFGVNFAPGGVITFSNIRATMRSHAS